MNNVILSVNDLKTYYDTPLGTLKAVDGVDLFLKRGEILGIAGESACGKSTVALSIMRLIRSPGKIVNGSIKYNNMDIIKMNKKELRSIRWRKISMVLQQSMNALNPRLRINKQLMEALTEHKLLNRAEAEKKAKIVLTNVGLDPNRIDNYPHEFSGGMKQRVLIAMALICDPEVIIFDEPTTALDVVVQNELLRLIVRISRENGLSVIWITHNLAVLSELCDRIAIMYAGKILEMGNSDTIINHPKHPYTKALIDSVTIMNDVNKEIIPIPGYPPNLINPPDNCRFYERCIYKKEICKEILPKVEKINKEDIIVCHNWKEIMKNESQ